MRKSTTGGHADEEESSVMMLIKPDLVKEQATSQSGVDQNRLQLPMPIQLSGGMRNTPIIMPEMLKMRMQN